MDIDTCLERSLKFIVRTMPLVPRCMLRSNKWLSRPPSWRLKVSFTHTQHHSCWNFHLYTFTVIVCWQLLICVFFSSRYLASYKCDLDHSAPLSLHQLILQHPPPPPCLHVLVCLLLLASTITIFSLNGFNQIYFFHIYYYLMNVC